MPGTTGSRRTVWGQGLTVLTVTVGLQCLRALFPVGYVYREANGIPTTALLLALAFASPVLVPFLGRRLPARAGLVGTTVTLVAARVALHAVDRVPMGLAVAAAAAGLVAIGVTVRALGDGRTAAFAVLGGLALDTALRAAWGTWDLSWQDGPSPVAATAVLLVLLLVAAVRAPESRSSHTAAARVGLALGPFLALQVLLLQNLGAVAAAAGLALATATGVVLLGDGLAAVATHLSAGHRTTRAVLLATTVGLAAVAWLLTDTGGAAAILLGVAGQMLAVLLLAHAATARSGATMPSTAVEGAACALGGLVLGLTLFLFQLHYDRPLPVSNRWLPVVAALVLGAAAVRAAPVAAAAASRMPSRRGLVTAAVVVLAAVVLVAGIAAGEPDARPAATPSALRVVTFNVHNAVTRDGRIAPEAVADTITRLDPDVVVIEEAGRGWLLSSTLDLGEWLKRRLDLPYRWAPAADRQMGNLVLSRVPIRDARAVALPKGTGTMRRSALIVRVGPVGREDVTVMGVHFQNGSTPDRKQTRIEETDVLLDAWGDAPRTVFAGDFNMDPGERDLRHVLAAGFTTTQNTNRCTLKTSNDNCVDWILVTDDLVQGPTRAPRTPEFDHNPVASVVRPR